MKATVTGLLVLIGAAGVAVFGLKPFSKTVWTDDVTETIALDMTRAARMEVSTDSGKIDYHGDDAAPHQVIVTKRGGGSTAEEAAEALAAIEIVTENDGETARLYWRWNGDKALNWRAYVALDVTGKSAVALDATTHNGNIAIDKVTGDLHAKTHNGEIAVRDIVGDIRVETHNGGLTVDGEGVRLEGETHNGSVDVAWKGAHIDLETHNGGFNVDLSQCAAIGGRISTHNGAVVVKTGPATAFELDAESKSSKIKAGVDLTAGKITAKRARGTLNGGTDQLRISTHNGSIEIQAAP